MREWASEQSITVDGNTDVIAVNFQLLKSTVSRGQSMADLSYAWSMKLFQVLVELRFSFNSRVRPFKAAKLLESFCDGTFTQLSKNGTL